MMMFQEGGIEWVDDLGGEIIEDSWIGKQLSKFALSQDLEHKKPRSNLKLDISQHLRNIRTCNG